MSKSSGDPKSKNLAKTIAYYVPLLERYARRMINDQAAAEKIVQEVLEDQYKIDLLMPSEDLRRVLKVDLYNRCYYRKQSIIFDRPPLKSSLSNSRAWRRNV